MHLIAVHLTIYHSVTAFDKFDTFTVLILSNASSALENMDDCVIEKLPPKAKPPVGGADGKHGMEEYLQTKVVYAQYYK